MNIFLIGYRCSGKTSVGKLLADSLGWSFIDADEELVKTRGMHITEFVSKQGWDAFRQMEKTIINRVSNLDAHVVATGGGAVVDMENVEHMKRNGVLVWLKAESEVIKKRMLQDKNTGDFRPALTSKEAVDEIGDMLSIRNPYYEKAMDIAVDTNFVDVDEICKLILKNLYELGYTLNFFK
jgi:shikimate kinase